MMNLHQAIEMTRRVIRLGISESALKARIPRLRQRHREMVCEEIGQAVRTNTEIDEDLRHLFAVLQG